MPIIKNQSSRKLQYFIGIGILGAFIIFGMLLQVSSQGDSAESYPKGFRGNTCTIETEALIIGYSSYYFPNNYEISGADPRMAYIPVQCGKIPDPSMFNISIDLLHPRESRDASFMLRLVKLTWIDDENVKEVELLTIPTQTYPDGVITQTFKLDDTGEYLVYLEGSGPNNTDYHLQVPITVGQDWRDTVRNFLPPILRKYI